MTRIGVSRRAIHSATSRLLPVPAAPVTGGGARDTGPAADPQRRADRPDAGADLAGQRAGIERPAHRDRDIVLARDLEPERDDQRVVFEREHDATPLIGELAEAPRDR